MVTQSPAVVAAGQAHDLVAEPDPVGCHHPGPIALVHHHVGPAPHATGAVVRVGQGPVEVLGGRLAGLQRVARRSLRGHAASALRNVITSWWSAQAVSCWDTSSRPATEVAVSSTQPRSLRLTP